MRHIILTEVFTVWAPAPITEDDKHISSKDSYTQTPKSLALISKSDAAFFKPQDDSQPAPPKQEKC